MPKGWYSSAGGQNAGQKRLADGYRQHGKTGGCGLFVQKSSEIVRLTENFARVMIQKYKALKRTLSGKSIREELSLAESSSGRNRNRTPLEPPAERHAE